MFFKLIIIAIIITLLTNLFSDIIEGIKYDYLKKTLRYCMQSKLRARNGGKERLNTYILTLLDLFI